MSFRNDFGYVGTEFVNMEFLEWLPNSKGFIYRNCLEDQVYIYGFGFSNPTKIALDDHVKSARCIQKSDSENAFYAYFITRSRDESSKSKGSNFCMFQMIFTDDHVSYRETLKTPLSNTRRSSHVWISADSVHLALSSSEMMNVKMFDLDIVQSRVLPRQELYHRVQGIGTDDFMSFDGRYVICIDYTDNDFELELDLDGYHYSRVILRIVDTINNNTVFSVECAVGLLKWSPVENKLAMCLSEIDESPGNLVAVVDDDYDEELEKVQLEFFTTIWTPHTNVQDLKKTFFPESCMDSNMKMYANPKYRYCPYGDLIWSPDGKQIFGNVQTYDVKFNTLTSPVFDCIDDEMVWKCNTVVSEKYNYEKEHSHEYATRMCWSPDSKSVVITHEIKETKFSSGDGAGDGAAGDVLTKAISFFSSDTGERILLIKAKGKVDRERDHDTLNFSPDGNYLVLRNYFSPFQMEIFNLKQYSIKTHLAIAPKRLKEGIFNLMLVRHRLMKGGSGLSVLPTEMWLEIVDFLARGSMPNARRDLKMTYGNVVPGSLQGIRWDVPTPSRIPALMPAIKGDSEENDHSFPKY